MSKKSKIEGRSARAAQALREQQAHERRRNVLTGVGIVLVLVVIVAGGFLINKTRDSSKDIAAPDAGSSEFGVAIGDPKAPNKVIIYEDFLCPFCGQLESASHEELAKLAEAGKVYVDYRPFNLLGPGYSLESTNAFAVVLDAAGPEIAKKFHDLLYADQPSEAGPFPDADWLVEKAVDAGATEDDVRSGIEDGAQESWVKDATAAANEAGVNSTPTILLNGTFFQEGRTAEELAANLLAAVG